MKKEPPEPKPKLGSDFRKAQPRLRVVANGSAEVNQRRAAQSAAVAITGARRKKALETDELSFVPTESKRLQKKAKKVDQKSLSSEVSVNVFIQSTDQYEPGSITDSQKSLARKFKKKEESKENGEADDAEGSSEEDKKILETSRNGNLITARVRVSELPRLLRSPKVTHVDLAENLRSPNPELGDETASEPDPLGAEDELEEHHNSGKGVIVGIIDVGGFDFAHPDFLDGNGNTRFLGIWDQGGDSRPSPYEARKDTEYSVPKIFDYGSEIVASHMNAAIKAERDGIGIPATELEPQSQMAVGSHGTHVASIAAGKSGVASKAGIAAVLVDIPRENEEDYKRRRSTFYDSTQLAHAVDYLMTLSRRAGRPISINISLGTNGHAHDGSSPICRWIDSWLTSRGSAVTVAAGNAGQEAPETAEDMGYVMGRIHTSGEISSSGLTTDIEWQVIGNGDQDISENELEIWYSGQDHFSVQVKPPDADWTEEIAPRQFIENRLMPNRSFLSIYNERYHPANGLNCISIYMTPFMNDDLFIGSKAGLWRVRLKGLEVRNGKFHGWIERDDPRRVPIGDGKSVWFLPSFFSERSNVDNSSVNSLACGHHVISVANLDEATETINKTSSQGPTRDGRSKPDIAAPGTDIVAAKGFSLDDRKWTTMSGTSMAAPYVSGVIALMLSVDNKLTAAQIEGIIRSTAQPLPGESYEWIDSAGFGRINKDKCVKEALQVNHREDVTE